jgi:hypothetical protein
MTRLCCFGMRRHVLRLAAASPVLPWQMALGRLVLLHLLPKAGSVA